MPTFTILARSLLQGQANLRSWTGHIKPTIPSIHLEPYILLMYLRMIAHTVGLAVHYSSPVRVELPLRRTPSFPLSRDHTKLAPEVFKLHHGQWFGEDICRLFFCRNILELHCSLFHHVSDVAIFDPDVFRPIMEYWVFGHLDTTLVITPDTSHIYLLIK